MSLRVKPTSVFSDFIVFCVTGKRNRTGARLVWNRQIYLIGLSAELRFNLWQWVTYWICHPRSFKIFN